MPFVILLTFPLRSLVDFAGIEQDVCVASVLDVLNVKGVEVGSSLSGLVVQGLVNPDLKKLTNPDGSATSEDNIRTWCEQHSHDWHEIFFDGVHCVWSADAVCREDVCPDVPASMLNSCLSQCITFAQTAQTSQGSLSSTSSQFLSSLNQCSTSTARASSTSLDSQLGTFNALADSQRMAAEAIGQASNSSAVAAEYATGILVGARTASLLLSSSLSILGGLAESLINVKAMFPGSQQASWVLILATFEAVPIHAALLAILQQLLGDQFLACFCVALVFYISQSALTGARALELQMDVHERWRLYRRVWLEYTMRFLAGAFAIGMLIAFMNRKFGSIQMLLASMSMAGPFVLLVINYLSRKILTAVAGTDMILSALLQTEFWRFGWTVADRDKFDEQVRELGRLLTPTHYSRVHPHASCSTDDGNTPLPVSLGLPDASISPATAAGTV